MQIELLLRNKLCHKLCTYAFERITVFCCSVQTNGRRSREWERKKKYKTATILKMKSRNREKIAYEAGVDECRNGLCKQTAIKFFNKCMQQRHNWTLADWLLPFVMFTCLINCSDISVCLSIFTRSVRFRLKCRLSQRKEIIAYTH